MRALQGMRALPQAGEVAVVETAEALQEAVAAGKPHIEIRAHLDLTVLDLIGFQVFEVIPATVKSIMVRFWFLFLSIRTRHRKHHPCT